MGVAVLGVDDLVVSLRNTAERSSRGVRDALDSGARDIQELARLQAPVDIGALEKSIKMDSFRDENSSSGRKAFIVYVDLDEPADDGKVVGDYAEMMHEGEYDLGPRSEAKQSANPGVIVGPKFLERAIDELEDDIQRAARDGLLKGIGK